MPFSARSSQLLSELNHRHVVSSVSTNSELIDAVKSGMLNDRDIYLLTAETQTAGRGQRARTWQSPHGNVYLSLYHPFAIPISGLLSLIVGTYLVKMPVITKLNDGLIANGLAPIGVKWANDLGFYHLPDIADTGLVLFNKLAGILIEPLWLMGKLVGVVIGVGLNVQATPTLTSETMEGMSYQAISLQDIHNQIAATKTNISLTEQTILPNLHDLYGQTTQALLAAIDHFERIATPASTPQTAILPNSAMDDFMQQFQQRDALDGLRLQVTQHHHQPNTVITGTACGIDTNGCLQLKQDNGNISALFTGRIDVVAQT